MVREAVCSQAFDIFWGMLLNPWSAILIKPYCMGMRDYAKNPARELAKNPAISYPQLRTLEDQLHFSSPFPDYLYVKGVHVQAPQLTPPGYLCLSL